MKFLNFLFSAFLVAAFLACGNEAPNQVQPPAPVPAPEGLQVAPPASDATSDVKRNPAHGEPGHRCDIPVGAPLDGIASLPVEEAQSPLKVNPPQPAPATTPVQAAPVQTVAAGMNPPHGEPGHRCDIPVGSPLPAQ